MAGLPPRIAKRYQPIQELGESRWSYVYKVYDPETKRRLALKLLKEPSDKLATLFETEYTNLRDLEGHEHIVKVIELGRHQGCPFLTMELIEGEDFLKYALGRTNEPTWPEQCSRFLLQLLGALAFMHARGIVHRDIKPLNVRVQIDPPAPPKVKVLDFGLSTRSPSAEEVGTYEFMAPELLRPDLFLASGEKVDHRADIYSVGVLAYMALGNGIYPSGRRESRTKSEILADLDRRTPTPRLLSDPVPDALNSIVFSMLAWKRDGRPGTAMEVAEALAEVYPSLDLLTLQQAGSTGRYRYQDAGGKLEDVISMARESRSAIIEVQGPRRSGKSRFVNESAVRFKLDRTMQPEVIECKYSRSGDLSDGPLECIPRRIRHLHPDREAELCDAYPSLFGKGRERVETDDPGQHLEDQLVGLLSMHLQDRSLVVTIDNASWAEGSLRVVLEASSRAIKQLSGTRARDRYLLVIVAVEPSRPQEVVRRHREITESPPVIELEPFSREDIRGFLERNWDWEPETLHKVMDVLEAQTGGNPGRIEDVMRELDAERPRGADPRSIKVTAERLALVTGGPPEADALFMEKLRGLPSDERTVLDVIATAVRLLTTRDLASLCPPLDPPAVEASLERLDQKGLVRRSVEDFQWWMDDSQRQLAYAEIDAETRRVIHKRIGLYLEERYRDNPAERYDVLAFHFARSSDPEAGRKYAERAAERFVEKNQDHRAIPRYLDAIGLHEALLAEGPADARRTKATLVRLHLDLARAMLSTWKLGEPGGPDAHLSFARALAAELKDDLLSARCVALSTEVELLQWSHLEGETPDARRRCRLELEAQIRALGDRTDAEVDAVRGDLLVQLGKVHRREKSLPEAERLFRRALDLARGRQRKNTNRIVSQIAFVMTMMGNPEGRTTALEAVELAKQERDRVGLAEAHRVLAIALHVLSRRLADADAEYRNATSVAEELHLTPTLRLIYQSHGDLLANMYASERALDLALRALAQGGGGSITARAHDVAGKALYLLSHYDLADEHLRLCIEYAEARADMKVTALEARSFRGRIQLELGEDEAGSEALHAVIDESGRDLPGRIGIPGECYLALGWHELRKAWHERLEGRDGSACGETIAALCAGRQSLLKGLEERDEDKDPRAEALMACARALSGDQRAWTVALDGLEKAVGSAMNFRIVWTALFAGLAAYFNGQMRHAEKAVEMGAEGLHKTQVVEVIFHTNLLLMLVNEKLMRDAKAALRFRKECVKRLKDVRPHLTDAQAHKYMVADPLRSLALKGVKA